MGTKFGIAKVKISSSGRHIHIQNFLKNPSPVETKDSQKSVLKRSVPLGFL